MSSLAPAPLVQLYLILDSLLDSLAELRYT